MTLVLVLAAGRAVAATWVPDAGVVLSGSAADVCMGAQKAAAAGVPWVSTAVGWENMEPSPEAYLAPDSPAVADLRAKLTCIRALDLSVEIRVNDAPAWASGIAGVVSDPPLPANVPAYARFLGYLATEFGGSIDAYSPWNEPNIRNFWNPPDAVAYVELQKAAYTAVKQADPTSIVLSAPLAGLSFSDPAKGAYAFIENAYKAGLKGYVDAVGWNAYPSGTPENVATDPQGNPAPSTLAGQLHLRSIIDRYDAGRPIWLMEFSWSTCPSCALASNVATEAQQADYLVRSFTYRRRYLAGSTDRIFWYQMHDPEQNPKSWLANLGLFRFDWSPKPAYAALAQVAVTRPPGAAATDPPSVVTPGDGSSGGGLPVPSLPTAGNALPASISQQGRRLKIGRVTLRLRNQKIALRAPITTSAPARVVVEGYSSRRWRRITGTKIPSSGILRIRFPDRGYLGIRVRARFETARAWQVGRVATVPKVKRAR